MKNFRKFRPVLHSILCRFVSFVLFVVNLKMILYFMKDRELL